MFENHSEIMLLSLKKQTKIDKSKKQTNNNKTNKSSKNIIFPTLHLR